MRTLCKQVLILGCVALSVTGAAASAQMHGDGEAIAMAKRMIETMGGAAHWSKAKWVYARETAYYATRTEPVDMEFWRRTDAPAEWSRRHAKTGGRTRAWTVDGGWSEEGGTVTPMPGDQLQESLGWWPGEIYVMYVRIAREDPALRIMKTGERSFAVLDHSNERFLGKFGVNAAGELVSWSYRYGADAVDYVYGPLKQRGSVRVPDFGALADGSFRFYYTDFKLSEADPPISLTSPRPAVFGEPTKSAGVSGYAPSSEPAAVAMARRMMDRMGDRKVWSEAKFMDIVEEVDGNEGTGAHRVRIQRRLDEPGLWYRSEASGDEFAYMSRGGWEKHGDEVTAMPPDQLRRYVNGWGGNLYVMYRRLAQEDATLRLVASGERHFVALDAATGERLCWFEVTAAGELLSWERTYGLSTEQWYYGPLTAFGPIRMPAWGVRSRDGYRFRYVSVDVQARPPARSFDPPAAPGRSP